MSAPIRSRLLTATPVEEHGLLFPVPWIRVPVTTAGGISKTATDSVSVTDSTARVVDYKRTVTDAVGVADSTSTGGVNVVAITDAVGVTDSTSRIIDFVRVVTEPVGVTDVVDSSVSTSAVNIVEAMGVTDSTSIVESSSSVASWGMIPIGI